MNSVHYNIANQRSLHMALIIIGLFQRKLAYGNTKLCITEIALHNKA